MARIHELYDFTVSAFIIHQNNVLLLHHKKLNTWLQPGGHVELNEDPEMALWREIEEETGLTQSQLTILEAGSRAELPKTNSTVKRLPIPFDINVHSFGADSTHKHIDMCYILRSSTSEINRNLAESNDLRWFSKSDLQDMEPEIWEDIYVRAQFALDIAS
jgi:8-oxo-dGTP diphosphatase